MHGEQQSIEPSGSSRAEKRIPSPNHVELLDLHIREQPDIELPTKHQVIDVWGATSDKGFSSGFNCSEAWNPLKIRNQLPYPSRNCRSCTDDGFVNSACRSGTPASGYTDSGYDSQFDGDTRSLVSSSTQGELIEACPFYASLPEDVKQSIKKNSLTCKICFFTAKNPSQKRKHDARHQKPHRCEENGCNSGFGTKNDLERHRKAVHNKSPRNGPTERYKCFGKDCGQSGKVWPRLDNFTAHLKRKHPRESPKDLIDRSREWYETSGKEEAADAPGTEPPTRKEPSNVNVNLSLDDNDSTANTITPSKIWNTPGSPGCYFDMSAADLQFNQFENETVPDMNVPAESAIEPIHAPTDTNYPPFLQPYHLRLPGIDDVLKSPIPGDTSESTMAGGGECSPQQGILPNVQAFDRGVALMQALTVAAFQNNRDQIVSGNTPSTNRDISQNVSGTGMKLPIIGQLSNEDRKLCLSILSQMHSQLGLQAPELDFSSKGNSPNDEHIFASDKGGPKQEGYSCSTCPKVFSSPSILKKHQKRHIKPYGCTFAGCYGTFGSKADWRRHESMQHCHVKCFRCSLPRGKHAECAAVFFQEEDFITHLNECDHGNSVINIQEQIDKSRLGFYDDRFYYWCGFCKEIKLVSKIGVDACNERFDHIETHLFQKDGNIKRWFPAKGHTMKGARKKIDKFRNKDRKEAPKKPGKRSLEDIDRSHNDNGHDDSETVYEVCSSSEDDTDNEAKQRSSSSYNQETKRSKVNPPVNQPVKQVETNSYQVYCCKCGDGPLSVTFGCCAGCPHKFCDDCPEEGIRFS